MLPSQVIVNLERLLVQAVARAKGTIDKEKRARQLEKEQSLSR